MPIFNLTVDDSSPLFVYSSGWSETNSSDPNVNSYLNHTYHQATSTGANVTAAFNGSAVWVSGAKRTTYGEFVVGLDGNGGTGSSLSQDADAFQQVLFSQTGLGNGPHSLVMVDVTANQSQPDFDIDFMTFTTGDGDASTVSVDTIIDDANPLVQYSKDFIPFHNGLSPQYHNNTFHLSQTPGASLQLPFTGQSIALYGGVSGNHGLFSVSVDGAPPAILSGNRSPFQAQVLLYYASNLANTSHVVTLAMADPNDKTFVDFDFAVVSQYFPASDANAHPSITPLPFPSQTTSTPSSSSGAATFSHHNNVSIGAVVGGVLGGLAVFAIAVVGVIFAISRRRRRVQQVAPFDEPPPPTAWYPSMANYSASDSSGPVTGAANAVAVMPEMRKHRLPPAEPGATLGSDHDGSVSSSTQDGVKTPSSGDMLPPHYATVFRSSDLHPRTPST